MCKPLLKGNSKPFYKYLLLASGSTTTCNHECAKLFNTYFHQQFCTDEQLVNTKFLPITSDITDIDEKGILNLITNLKNKSPDPDNIRKCELLVHPALTARCLKHIFQISLNSDKLPSAWKTANVTPIHKKGPSDEVYNYRPISLTSIPCKMMEHIVLHHLNNTLDSILHSRQHGFRRGLSCETQLCSTYHDIAKLTESSSVVHAEVLDCKKSL